MSPERAWGIVAHITAESREAVHKARAIPPAFGTRSARPLFAMAYFSNSKQSSWLCAAAPRTGRGSF